MTQVPKSLILNGDSHALYIGRKCIFFAFKRIFSQMKVGRMKKPHRIRYLDGDNLSKKAANYRAKQTHWPKRHKHICIFFLIISDKQLYGKRCRSTNSAGNFIWSKLTPSPPIKINGSFGKYGQTFSYFT